MSGLETAGGVFALVELSAKVASLCVQYSVDVKHARNDIIRLRTQVNDLEAASANILQLLDGPHSRGLKASQPLRRAIDDGLSELQRLYDSLRPKTARQALSRLGFRSLKWPLQAKEVEKIRQSLRQSTQSMCLALQIDQTSILLNIDQRTVLDRLPVVEGAYYDSSSQEHNRTCLPNTRVELLRQITEWAKDAKSESVFWLNGMAGTGKSTISRTVAQTLANDGYLGASFFFKRGEADRGSISKFFTTIAADLVVRKPEIASEMKQILENDPSTTTKNAREQFDRLFIQPLSSASLNSDTVVIVVDALDECDREDDVKLMIRLFSGVHIQSPTRIKVFLTSRPELPSRVGFQSMDGNHQNALLHAVPIPVVQRDISFFLEYELTKIRDEYNISVANSLKFSSDWPSDADIRALVSMAVPLFIFAATVCRFIADRKYGNPGKQLTRVLSYQSKSHIAALNETYLLVLNRQLADLNAEEKKETIQEFCDIVGSIVILESPLSTISLAKILDIPERTIADRLDLLHSVLSVPQSTDSPVRLLHLSFRDFLLDTANASNNDFWIDEKKAHVKMAANCLRLLKCLKEDICDVKEPGTPRATISATTVGSCLPSEVRYACLYWIYHVEKADTSISDGDEIHSFLTRDFLYWIEGLALMGRAYESLGLVRNLRSLLKPEDCATIAAFLDDALLFLGAYISTIDSTPLQLYSSLLMFAPRKSIIRNCFQSKVKCLSLWPIVDEDWTQCIQTFEGHAAWLQAVAFSHDSKLLASASGDTDVRIWHTDTGKCAYVLNHHGEVNSVAFSHDSTLLAACDISVRIWRTDTGECVRVLDGHRSFVTCVVFSHDSTLLASASSDKTIIIWQSITGEVVRVMEGHDDIISSVTFSHDSKLLASASYDKSVRIWSADTGEQVRVLQGHGESATSVAFSHDSTVLASASRDKTICIWDVETGRLLRVLEGHKAEVSSVAFSRDSALLVSASADNTLRVWRTDMEYSHTVLTFSHGIISAVLSRDSTHVASASWDRTARIWKVNTSENSHNQWAESHDSLVTCLATSHDASLLVSGSANYTVRLWSAITGEYIRTFDAYMDMTRSLAFSSDSELVLGEVTDNAVQVWCAASGKCVMTSDCEPVPIICARLVKPGESHIPGGATCTSHSWLYLDSCHDFSTDRRWIKRNGVNWIWLPTEYRPHCAITSSRAVVIGAGSGRVITIGFTDRSTGEN